MADQRNHRYAHGQKVVCPAIPGRNIVQVLDFNVHPSCPRPGTTFHFTRGRLVTDPTTLDRAHIFKKKVRTTLPFYSTSRKMKKEYSGFMIDEQRIIALKVQVPAAFDIPQEANVFADAWRCR